MVSTAELSGMLRDVQDAFKETGVFASLVDPGATYSTASGGVTEAAVSTGVWASPLVDESKRWLDPSITATVYIAAYQMSVIPRAGFRIVINGRTFAVIAVFAYSLHDTVISWRLDVGEVG